MTRNKALPCCLSALPWVLVLVGGVLLFLGLAWRDLSGSDNPNGPLIASGVVLIALAFATSCVKDRPRMRVAKAEQAEQAAPENAEAQLPFVSI
jgi:hypothetical protein